MCQELDARTNRTLDSVLEAMSLWFCSDCKIPFGPQPFCPRCGKPGVWQR